MESGNDSGGFSEQATKGGEKEKKDRMLWREAAASRFSCLNASQGWRKSNESERQRKEGENDARRHVDGATARAERRRLRGSASAADRVTGLDCRRRVSGNVYAARMGGEDGRHRRERLSAWQSCMHSALSLPPSPRVYSLPILRTQAAKKSPQTQHPLSLSLIPTTRDKSRGQRVSE